MADGVCRGDDQSADSGAVGLMGRPTGYIGVMTSQLTVVCLAVLNNHIDIILIIKIQYSEV